MHHPETQVDVTHEFITQSPAGVLLYQDEIPTIFSCYGTVIYFKLPFEDYKYTSKFSAKRRLRELHEQLSKEKQAISRRGEYYTPEWENLSIQLDRVARATIQEHTEKLSYYLLSRMSHTRVVFEKAEIQTTLQKIQHELFVKSRKFATSFGYHNAELMLHDTAPRTLLTVLTQDDLLEIRSRILGDEPVGRNIADFQMSSKALLKLLYAHVTQIWAKDDLHNAPREWLLATIDDEAIQHEIATRQF